MKTVYIPKGETLRYDALETEQLVVKGCLHVLDGVKAKHISGDGIIVAGSISADTIRARELEAAHITCKRLIAKRVTASEVVASESAAVSCYLTAAYVHTGRLTVAANEIHEVKAEQVVNLSAKKRSLLGTLLASSWRAFWLSLTTPAIRAEAMDAEYRPADEEKPAEKPVETASATDAEPADDFELQRIIAQFKLARESGYTLRLIPGTPENNAPVFDFGTGASQRNAA